METTATNGMINNTKYTCMPNSFRWILAIIRVLKEEITHYLRSVVKRTHFGHFVLNSRVVSKLSQWPTWRKHKCHAAEVCCCHEENGSGSFEEILKDLNWRQCSANSLYITKSFNLWCYYNVSITRQSRLCDSCSMLCSQPEWLA